MKKAAQLRRLTVIGAVEGDSLRETAVVTDDVGSIFRHVMHTAGSGGSITGLSVTEYCRGRGGDQNNLACRAADRLFKSAHNSNQPSIFAPLSSTSEQRAHVRPPRGQEGFANAATRFPPCSILRAKLPPLFAPVLPTGPLCTPISRIMGQPA
jgi:hypothetical protein